MKTAYLFLMGFFLQSGLSAFAVDLTQIENDLKGPGVAGFIHGAVETDELYVFTYRSPNDFFDYVQMSLVPSSPEISKILSTLDRHDQVLIKGSFMKNPSPQKHILLTELSVIKKYQSGMPTDDYIHQADLPTELTTINQATFLVHAIGGDGHILVVEYKDSIVPIFVKNKNLTANLYRNDLVELKFRVRRDPDQPVHLALNETDPDAIKILESIKAIHGTPATVEGALILFPKSPEIIFNVFAVEQTLVAGLKRQFTIVNFDDQALFAQARTLLQEAWDRHPGAYVNGRNKLVSTAVRVRVRGTFNEISANQANPQILFQSLDQIEILE